MAHAPKNRPFRFPAFEDDKGVKLYGTEKERSFFRDFDFITDHFSKQAPLPVKERNGLLHTQYDSPDFADEAQTQKFTIDNAHPLDLEKEHLAHQKQHFPHMEKFTNPTYEPMKQRTAIREKSQGSRILKQKVDMPTKVNWSEKKNMNPRLKKYKEELERDKGRTLKQQYSGGVNRFRSRQANFPPEHTHPYASFQPKYSTEELLESLHKKEETYLLMEVDLEKNRLWEATQKEGRKRNSWQLKSPRISATQKKTVITSATKESLQLPKAYQQSNLVKKGTTLINARPTFREVKRPLREEKTKAADFAKTDKKQLISAAEIRANSGMSAKKETFLNENRFTAAKQEPPKRRKALGKTFDGVLQSEQESMKKVGNRYFDKNF